MQRDSTRSATRDPGLLILASLAAGPRHGYAMVEDIAAFGGGRLGPGTLYGTIKRLLDETAALGFAEAYHTAVIEAVRRHRAGAGG